VPHAFVPLHVRLHIRQTLDRLKAVPCARCRVEYPPYVMQFDHLPGKRKHFNVSHARNGRVPLSVVLREAAKCQVVCANCHLELEHARVCSPLESQERRRTRRR